MSQIIAYCTNIDTYNNNRIFQKEFAGRYPGTQWLPILKSLLNKDGHIIVTGDKAVSNVNESVWDPKQIVVIQDLDAKDGQLLINKGANPSIVIALESPLYAYTFYKKIKKIAPQFSNRILFPGFNKFIKSKKGRNYTAYFPSYNKNVVFPRKNWNQRKFMTLVATNKYFKKQFPLKPKYISEHYDWTKDNFWIVSSEIRKKAIESELITKRLEAVEYFGGKNLIDLYGSDWDNLDNLPVGWQKRLKDIIARTRPKPIRNKLKTISSYKFALCFENTSYPGYITEKIIHCFVTGVIPIYLGAPDITKFVPANAFIDMSNFNSFSKLHEYLADVSEQDGLKLISAGRDFLKKTGRIFSNEYFADFILNLLNPSKLKI